METDGLSHLVEQVDALTLEDKCEASIQLVNALLLTVTASQQERVQMQQQLTQLLAENACLKATEKLLVSVKSERDQA
eukprot:CAMPEP_0175169278 /NCGR_PEP_ID=MMETSP0087-20121206/29480_1 /TAXON_ID=136419 /ORGANISM="Unknown Unknown, Strain D1" /LENGTH=77 /DNA_ID=CAMNT_0016459603 /DNA_START=37 /DNA_END=267 /DNA_ORIENTATION=-